MPPLLREREKDAMTCYFGAGKNTKGQYSSLLPVAAVKGVVRPPGAPGGNVSFLTPVSAEEKPREKLKGACLRKGTARGNISCHFGLCGKQPEEKEAEATAGASSSEEDRKKKLKEKTCGPYIERDKKDKEKVLSFAEPGTVFADVKNPKKDLDPDTEAGAKSRRNILKWLKVYSEDAAERTRRSNDEALFKG
jgi:hypothetical protein